MTEFAQGFFVGSILSLLGVYYIWLVVRYLKTKNPVSRPPKAQKFTCKKEGCGADVFYEHELIFEGCGPNPDDAMRAAGKTHDTCHLTCENNHCYPYRVSLASE